MIVAAGRDDTRQAEDALGNLYRAYRPPLLAYLRMCGNDQDAAEDLLQGFFEFLLEKHGLSKVEQRGKFRSWLLTCLKHYVHDRWDKARAAKRGGGVEHAPVLAEGEEGGVHPRHAGRTPDQEYDRQFALRFLQLVRERLAAEYRLNGKQDLYVALESCLTDRKADAKHDTLAQSLGMSTANVAQSISRLRYRYRSLFDEELTKLVGLDGNIAEEKEMLLNALRS